MSHTVKSSPRLHNMASVVQAFRNLGWTVTQNTHIRGWAGDTGKATYPFVISHPKCKYDIGLKQEGDQVGFYHEDYIKYEDPWKALGNDLSRLKQQYTLAQVTEVAMNNMGNVDVTVNPDQTLSLVIEMEVM